MAKPQIEWVAWDTESRATRHTGPHNFSGRCCKWSYCTKCGLILLRNTATNAAARKPCTWQE